MYEMKHFANSNGSASHDNRVKEKSSINYAYNELIINTMSLTKLSFYER